MTYDEYIQDWLLLLLGEEKEEIYHIEVGDVTFYGDNLFYVSGIDPWGVIYMNGSFEILLKSMFNIDPYSSSLKNHLKQMGIATNCNSIRIRDTKHFLSIKNRILKREGGLVRDIL